MERTQQRLPTLHLPEMTRDDVARSIAAFELPDVMANLEMPKINLPRIDLARAASDVAVAVHLKPRRRSRWPWAIGGVIVAGVVAGGWVLLTNNVVRERLERVVDGIRERFDAMRTNDIDDDEDVRSSPDVEVVPIATVSEAGRSQSA